MIPNKVKVGGMQYEVKVIDNMFNDREMYGEVTYANQLIKIASDINEPRQFNAFIHELTHALLFESGDDEINQDEAFVRRFSNLLTQVIIDNNWEVR